MEVKIRSIGNSLGIILPKDVTSMMNFHAEDVIELEVAPDEEKLIIERKRISLKENLLAGIEASQDDNISFANDFDELEGEI